jgi:amidase
MAPLAGVAAADAETRTDHDSRSDRPFSELEEATIDQLQGAIEALDRRGPRLNSVLEIIPDAEAIACHLDNERRAGRVTFMGTAFSEPAD